MPSNTSLSTKTVVRACKARGWSVHPHALKGLLAHVDTVDTLETVLDRMVADKMKAANLKTLTAAVWEEVLDDYEQENSVTTTTSRSSKKAAKASPRRKSAGGGDWHANLEVVQAFQTPRLVFQVMRKQFTVEDSDKTRWSLMGTAQDKMNMMARRYALVYQRVLRHELFRPTGLGHSARSSMVQHKLTPIESLLGKHLSHNQTLLLLGFLVQVEEGQYYLEDPTGQVPLSFQEALPVDGFFVTELCSLLVEGRFQDGILYVHRVGLPLLETRQASLQAIQQQVVHPMYTRSSATTLTTTDASFVVLSDVHLDQPRVLQQLEGLLASYENYSRWRLPLFVLMGNFTSTGDQNIKAALEELGSLIAKFSKLAAHAHFLLIPGPNDGGGHVLPLPPFSKLPVLQQQVAHLHWGSNPCRVCYAGKEMVIFRYNLLHVLQQQQVLLQSKHLMDETEDEAEAANHEYHRKPHCRLVKTVLDQGHLVPVPGMPVYWNYDHALSLYPLPDALVLGDAANKHFYESYGGVDAMCPGSLARHGSYAVYAPDASMKDDDDSTSSDPTQNVVEFGQLGDEEY